MYLHDAIINVLSEKDGQTPRQIAIKINTSKSYVRKDGELLETQQISARINKYPNLFKKENGKIYLEKNLVSRESSHTKLSSYKNKATIITETKCICNSCQNIWYYGKSDVMISRANDSLNRGKELLCCTGCLPALFITDKVVVDHNKCPKCGTRSITKSTISHYV